jgi:beta-glucanase (GH16 family)
MTRSGSILILLAASAALAGALPAQIWSEEFNSGSAPDPRVWSYDTGASGWGNNELQNYTTSSNNVRVQGGNLIITALRQNSGGAAFTSARIRTQDKLTFQYGTVEARSKVPDLANGLWPAFWMLGNNFSSAGWPRCGEIDILEMGESSAIGNGLVNRRARSTAHWDFNGNYSNYSLSRDFSPPLAGSFHVYRLEWTPTQLSTYVDGQWVWTMNIANPASFSGEEFHQPHFFILNMAVGGNYPGIYNPGQISAPMPAELVVDYIRIFDNGHTILGGTSLGDGSNYTGPANLLYSMKNPVRLNCTNSNQATVVGDQAVLSFSPGAQAYAYPMCDYGTWAAFFGDVDGDGFYDDDILGAVDAIWAPPGTPATPSLFDVFVSVQNAIPAGGFAAQSIAPGDVFQPTTTGIRRYISEAQVLSALGAGNQPADVNGFAVDPATNDIYLTFSHAVTLAGTTMQDGGVARIPGSAATLRNGVVSSVTSGSAEVVLTEADVHAMFLNAGLDGVTSCCGIELDPNGGTFTSASTNRSLPHLWLCDDDASDEGFVSTRLSGQNGRPGCIPSVNGVALLGGNALGLSANDPLGGTVDNPTGIAFLQQLPSRPLPMYLDAPPIGAPTPWNFHIDLAGATPLSFVFYVGELFDGSLPGGFPSRSAASPIPLVSPSWHEFYPGLPSVGIAALVRADVEGFARYSLSVGSLPAGIGVKWQCADLTTLNLSAPLITVTR